jgi:hypothetical protein
MEHSTVSLEQLANTLSYSHYILIICTHWRLIAKFTRANNWSLPWGRRTQYCNIAKSFIMFQYTKHYNDNILHYYCCTINLSYNGYIPSFMHLLYCTTYSKFLNPLPWRNSPSWAGAPSLPWLHDHTQTHHTLVRLPSTSDRPDAKTPIWQHTTLTRDRHPCPRWDSNSQSHHVNGGRPTPYTARPLGLAKIFKYCTYSCGAIGWGTVLQTGRPWVQFPMVSLEFFIDTILLAALWPWGLLGL